MDREFKRLSFVVPAYNAKNHICKCLDSLLSQDLNDEEYEILVINDGSTDDTASIVKAYQSNNSSIRLISQENKGLAQTRNIGISNANGEYVWFIDADDYIVENCADRLLSYCENEQLDMFLVAPSAPVTSNFDKDWHDKKPIIRTGQEIILSGEINVGAWAYIIRKDFFRNNNLEYLDRILFEDSELTPRALFYAQRVGSIDFSVYHYIQHGDSIMHRFSPIWLDHIIRVAGSLRDFRSNTAMSIELQQQFRKMQDDFSIAGLNFIAARHLSKELLYRFVTSLKSNRLLPLYSNSKHKKRKFLARFISFNPVLYVRLRQVFYQARQFGNYVTSPIRH